MRNSVQHPGDTRSDVMWKRDETRRSEQLEQLQRQKDEAQFWKARLQMSRYPEQLTAYPYDLSTGATYARDYRHHGLKKHEWNAMRSANKALWPDARFTPTSLV